MLMEVALIGVRVLEQHREFRLSIVLHLGAIAERVVHVSGVRKAHHHPTARGQVGAHYAPEKRLPVEAGAVEGVDGDDEIEAAFRFDGERLELEIRSEGATALSDSAVGRFDEICGPLIDAYDIEPAQAWIRMRKTPAPLD